jgi:diguanylate cyclase (GGDEF)-like protein
MTTIAYVEVNVFALTILFIIFMNIHHHAEKYLFEQKLFLALLCSNALLLILDTMLWLLDGKPGMPTRYTILLLTTVYLVLNPLPCVLWTIYVNYQVYRDEERIGKLLIPLLIPVFVTTVVTVSSWSKGYVFFIDQNNVYHRGKLFIMLALICFAYFVYTTIFIIIKQKQIERKYFIPILFFAVPPFIGGILQSLFYGISLVWVCMAISVQIVFINIQNSQLHTDYLTGLYNRRQLDYYLQEQVRNSSKNSLLAGIMIDLNSFKEINDLWGHSTGDKALVDAGNILTSSFRKNDLICRYGGDEFVVIMEIKEKSDMIKAVERIRTSARQFDETKIAPYKISFSMGYDIYDLNSDMTVQQFLRHIDSLMYEDKKNKSNLIKA